MYKIIISEQENDFKSGGRDLLFENNTDAQVEEEEKKKRSDSVIT